MRELPEAAEVQGAQCRRDQDPPVGMAGAGPGRGSGGARFGVAIFQVGGQVVEEGAPNPVGPLALGFLAGFLSGGLRPELLAVRGRGARPGSPLMSFGGHALRWPPS